MPKDWLTRPTWSRCRPLLLATAVGVVCACESELPSIDPDDGSAGPTSDAGPIDPLGTVPAPGYADIGLGASAGAGWTSPPTCPLATEEAHCPACWSHTDEGAESLDRNESGDEFGAAVAVGDFNGDGYPDLAVGAPGEDIGAYTNAGAVYLFLGTASGFQPWRVAPNATPAANERYGANLLAADFDADGRDELVIVRGGAVSTPLAIVELEGTSLQVTQQITLAQMDPADSTQTTSRAGLALAAGEFISGDLGINLAVGAPRYELEDVERGAVFVLENTEEGLAERHRLDWGEDSDLLCGFALAGGDRDGVGGDELAVGCPGAERVLVFDGTTLDEVHDSSFGIPGFGYSVIAVDLDEDGDVELVAGGDDSDARNIEIVGEGETTAYDGEAERLRVLTAGDVNADGDVDILAVADDSSGNHTPVWYAGDGTVSLGSETAFDGGSGRSTGDRFGERGVLVDTNGDNFLDFVVGAPGPSSAAGVVHSFITYWAAPAEYWGSGPNPTRTDDQETALDPSCEECVVFAHPDGEPCGDHTGVEICVFGECVTRGCGDGYRELGTEMYTPPGSREGCDDGNTADGDACSSTCDATLLFLASTDFHATAAAPSRQAQALAEDGNRDLLFVFQEDYLDATGEVRRRLRGQAANYGGAPAPPSMKSGPSLPDDSLADLATGWDAQANVAGLPGGGWVIVWTDPDIDGAGSGIAMRRVASDGSLGPVVAANQVVDGDQHEPRVTVLTDSVVVVWTDTYGSFQSSRIETRTFDLALAPQTDEVTLTPPDHIALQPALASSGDEWIVAWTRDPNTPFDLPSLYAQRFGATSDPGPLQVTSQGASPSITTMPDGDYALTWETRDVDFRGDIWALELYDSGGSLTATEQEEITVVGGHAELAPAIAPFDATSFLVTYEDGGERSGIAYDSGDTAVALPSTESTLLGSYLSSRLQGDPVMLRTDRGVWFAWSVDLRDPATTDLVFEAEQPDAQGSLDGYHSWVESTSEAGYSGAGYMLSDPDTPGWDVSPSLLFYFDVWMEFDFTVPSASTYRMVFRSSAPDTSSDSFHWRIDGGTVHTEVLPVAPGWQWHETTVSIPLTAGAHTLRVSMNEPGFALDRIELSDAVMRRNSTRSFVAFLVPPS